MWNLLEKAGNASGKEHVKIIKRFVKIFGKDFIAGVLEEREFTNAKFFRWLTTKKIPFYVRIKNGAQVSFLSEKTFAIRKIFKRLNSKEQICQK